MALLLMSVTQIVLRVFFDTGFIWAEAVSRQGVLWLALLSYIMWASTHTGDQDLMLPPTIFTPQVVVILPTWCIPRLPGSRIHNVYAPWRRISEVDNAW